MRSGSMFDDVIREHGWAVQGVFDAPGTSGPCWAYTIGLEDQDRPELVMVGMPIPIAQGLLNRVIADAVHGEQAWPEAGATIAGLAQNGYELRVVAVDPDVAAGGEWFLGALARRGNSVDFRLLQLVWQHADYSWPDDHSEEQPLLGPRWW